MKLMLVNDEGEVLVEYRVTKENTDIADEMMPIYDNITNDIEIAKEWGET